MASPGHALPVSAARVAGEVESLRSEVENMRAMFDLFTIDPPLQDAIKKTRESQPKDRAEFVARLLDNMGMLPK